MARVQTIFLFKCIVFFLRNSIAWGKTQTSAVVVIATGKTHYTGEAAVFGVIRMPRRPTQTIPTGEIPTFD
jgi:hypothetical protein